jgi:AraC-like DNA-binding protein
MRATRLREIQNDIVNNLGRHVLSIHGVASRHWISPSYLRQLFAAEGTTFSKFVLEQRLNAARGMLCDPRFADRSITAIAFAVGFGDLPSFNRLFRRRFDIMPSEVRGGTNASGGSR